MGTTLICVHTGGLGGHPSVAAAPSRTYGALRLAPAIPKPPAARGDLDTFDAIAKLLGNLGPRTSEGAWGIPAAVPGVQLLAHRGERR